MELSNVHNSGDTNQQNKLFFKCSIIFYALFLQIAEPVFEFHYQNILSSIIEHKPLDSYGHETRFWKKQFLCGPQCTKVQYTTFVKNKILRQNKAELAFAYKVKKTLSTKVIY